MYEQNMVYEEPPIHFGHLGAIALCAIALVGITVMRNGFSFKPDVQEQAQLLTYEQIYAQAAASAGGEEDPTGLAEIDAQTEAELAAIDPSRRPQVAGASTEDASAIFTPESIAAIKINLQTAPTTKEALENYSYDMNILDVRYNTMGILEAINSSDPQVLNKAAGTAAQALAAMQGVSVPRGVEYYHKHQMLLYRTLGEMANVLAGNKPANAMPVYSSQLVELMGKLDNMRQEIIAKHGVVL